MKKLSDIKLIASDIDGTLLDHNSRLPDSFFKIYNELKGFGIEFVIASGRQINNLREIFNPIKDDLTYIAQNGSYVVSKGKEMHADPIRNHYVSKLIAEARKIPDVHILAYGMESLYIEDNSSDFLNMLKECRVSYKIVRDVLEINNDCIFKISIYDTLKPATNSYPFLAHFSSDLNFAISGDFWLDITNKYADKGHALSLIQKHFNVSSNQTMVFGDYENDLDMMRHAYFSYAMGNASDKIKNAARFTAPSNTEDGVLTIVQHVINSINGK